MKLLICEKPLQAQDYVKVFERYTNKKFKKEIGYYTNGDMIISYAMGHVIELAQPELYNPKYKQWNVEDLPILPNPFKLIVTETKKAQFKVLKSLLENATEVYNATDAEREGELIFRYITSLCKLPKNQSTKRIWVKEYKYETIIKSYHEAKDQSYYEALYQAAKARSHADWLIGINATRMLTVASNANATLTLGRIQTAILRLIVDRYIKNINFKPETTYTPSIQINETEIGLNKTYLKAEEAENILKNTAEKLECQKIVKEENIKQPVLYSLPDLQIKCNQKYNFSASQTLEFAQKLYENRIISYPRTSSNYLTESQKNDIKSLLKYYISNQNYNGVTEKDFLENIENHFIFNDKKTSDHYAIIPLETSEDDIALNQEEKLVFKEIKDRFLECFMKPAIVENTKILFYLDPKEKTEESICYKTTGKKIKYAGFLKINPQKDIELPLFEDKKNYKVEARKIKQGKTSTAELFTEATLLKAMQNPLAHEKIEENKENIKSLGTAATNDKFLPILIKRNYVSFQKKYIIPTNLGIEIIQKLIKTKLTSIALTAQIENEIENIRNGNMTYEKFMNAIVNYTKTLMQEIKNEAKGIGIKVENEDKKRIACPKCKTGNLYLAKSKNNLYCNAYKKEETPCDFILFTNIAGKKLSDKNIQDLLEKKETASIQFKNKAGAEYKAKIILNGEFKTEMAFINDKK